MCKVSSWNALTLWTWYRDISPIVAVNAKASDPHYYPTADQHQPIQPGDFVLIDLWAKQNAPDAVYADTTWVAYAGEIAPQRYIEVFEVVRDARDLAIRFIRENFALGKPVHGYAVDDVVRNYITDRGYGEFLSTEPGIALARSSMATVSILTTSKRKMSVF